MMQKPNVKFSGVVDKGKLKLDHQDYFNKHLQTLGGKVVVWIKRDTGNRTLSQNALYWAYLNIIEDETGNSADELHEYLKRKLLNPRHIKVLGEDIKLPSSTTSLDTQMFSDYMTRIEHLTSIPIPAPEYL